VVRLHKLFVTEIAEQELEGTALATEFMGRYQSPTIAKDKAQ
jgi:hypothetical protein